MNNKEKKIAITLFILAIVFTIMGSTLAYWSWQTSVNDQTNVTFTVTAGFSCSGDGGGSITSQQKMLAPTSCTNENYAFQREVTTNVSKNRDGSVYMDLWLDVTTIGEGLSNSQNFRYALTEQSNDCEHNILAEGTFNGVVDGGRVTLLEGTEYPSSGNNTYYLYVWLDAAEESSSTQNQPFNISLGGQCTDEEPPKPNAPVLDTGMIPVKISDTGVVTAVSEDDDTWFDYDNKQWANAVLVKETGTKTRTANKVAGTTINPNDILAYFVWIPRYSYKVWQYSGVADRSTNPISSIDIKFVKKNVKELATQNNEYYTHPAFTFGTQELDGIWVGKFETSTDTSNRCYNSYNSTDCIANSVSPRIVPSVSALRFQNINNQFLTALKFANSTFYGLSSSANSHMMKNSEWGAVAYLTYSKYGINGDVRINNYYGNYKTLTGCGADSANIANVVTTCAIPYGTVSGEIYTYPQSTTGNIYGIFDMVGGLGENVLGNYNKITGSSGLNASFFTDYSEYYDLYSSDVFIETNSGTRNVQYCTLATCGGHALNETWNPNIDSFVYSNNGRSWFYRGNSWSWGNSANIFYANDCDGQSSSSFGFHTVVIMNSA